MRTALDARELGWLQESAALAQLERCGTLLLRTAGEGVAAHVEAAAPDASSREHWARRYSQAVSRMRDAGIPTRTDQDAGARDYIELRASWQPGIEALARALGWCMAEVDTRGRENT